MIYLLLLVFLLLIYYFPIIEYLDEVEDIYNYKTSKHFKQMFDQPTIWLGYQDFDGSLDYNKLFINNFNNSLFKEKNTLNL